MDSICLPDANPTMLKTMLYFSVSIESTTPLHVCQWTSCYTASTTRSATPHIYQWTTCYFASTTRSSRPPDVVCSDLAPLLTCGQNLLPPHCRSAGRQKLQNTRCCTRLNIVRYMKLQFSPYML